MNLHYSFLLALSIPVLADDNTFNTTPAPTVQATSTDEETEANQGQYKQYMEPVRELQKQEREIREQIRSIKSQVHQQAKTARKAKNYAALSAALDDMIAMQDDIIAVTNAKKTCFTDWQQYYTDRQAKNMDGIIADLQKLETDITQKLPLCKKY